MQLLLLKRYLAMCSKMSYIFRANSKPYTKCLMRPSRRIVSLNVLVVRLCLWTLSLCLSHDSLSSSYLIGSWIGIFVDVGPPKQNRYYQPSSNGCGSLGLNINTEYLPAVEMENCCNSHDICYDTCNRDKELCDLDFKRCLYNYCDTHEKSTVGSIVAKGCKAAAKMLSTGTITLGCKSYLDSQERACYCPPPSSRSRSDNNKKNKKYQQSDTNYGKGPPPSPGWNI